MIDTTTHHPAKPTRPLPMSRHKVIERMLVPMVFDARPVRRSRIDAALQGIGEGPVRDTELDGALVALWVRREAGGGAGPSGQNYRG